MRLHARAARGERDGEEVAEEIDEAEELQDHPACAADSHRHSSTGLRSYAQDAGRDPMRGRRKTSTSRTWRNSIPWFPKKKRHRVGFGGVPSPCANYEVSRKKRREIYAAKRTPPKKHATPPEAKRAFRSATRGSSLSRDATPGSHGNNNGAAPRGVRSPQSPAFLPAMRAVLFQSSQRRGLLFERDKPGRGQFARRARRPRAEKSHRAAETHREEQPREEHDVACAAQNGFRARGTHARVLTAQTRAPWEGGKRTDGKQEFVEEEQDAEHQKQNAKAQQARADLLIVAKHSRRRPPRTTREEPAGLFSSFEECSWRGGHVRERNTTHGTDGNVRKFGQREHVHALKAQGTRRIGSLSLSLSLGRGKNERHPRACFRCVQDKEKHNVRLSKPLVGTEPRKSQETL